MILKGSDSMFGKLMARLFGKEMNGEIVNVEDTLSIDVRSALPQKKVTVRYCVHGEDYFVSRELMDVLSKQEKELWIGNMIRILVDPINPRHAYINEFDYPEYDL